MVATATPRVSVPHYAGIATRGVALAIDAAIANAIVLLTAALVALISSMVGDLHPQWLVAALATIGWTLVLIAYFSLFWTTTGQTPGMRLMQLRVMTTDGERLHLVRSLGRVVALGLAIIPLFAGFLPVLFDARRRGVHDMLAGTLVVHAPAAR